MSTKVKKVKIGKVDMRGGSIQLVEGVLSLLTHRDMQLGAKKNVKVYFLGTKEELKTLRTKYGRSRVDMATHIYARDQYQEKDGKSIDITKDELLKAVCDVVQIEAESCDYAVQHYENETHQHEEQVKEAQKNLVRAQNKRDELKKIMEDEELSKYVTETESETDPQQDK